MHIDEALRAVIDQPTRNCTSTAMVWHLLKSMLNLNKGRYVSTFSGAPSYPESSEDVSMEASADKRSRALPDTTTKPDGKLLKTSEVASPSPARHDISESCDDDTHVFDVSGGQEANSKPSTTRRTANDASEARFLTRQMHRRVPAWKPQMCIEALNASPIGQTPISEVTEIHFATDELVAVAAQCLADLARESESLNQSAERVSTTPAAPTQAEKESINVGRLLVSQKTNLRVLQRDR